MLSVIVPTHNRAESAARLARALDSQQCDAPFEVVFALDGCTDDTREVLESVDLGMVPKIVELPGLGAAAARNRGAASATGELLLFVDDDVVPQPGMLDAHVASHTVRGRSAVVGLYPYAPDMSVNPLDFFIRDWWHSRFEALADPTHTFTYRDCLTGNLSLPRREFEAVGGFDEAFQKDGREDYDLGARLLKSGAQIRLAPDALAYHYPINRPKSLLGKRLTFGRADIYFAQKHPEVFWTLPISHYCRRTGWLEAQFKGLALSVPLRPAFMISMMGSYFEKRLDQLWNERLLRLWRRSLGFAYLLGAVSAVGGLREFRTFARGWLDAADRPRRWVRINDVDILSEPCEIGEADRYDRLFAIPRLGGTILGWVEVPRQQGQESVPAAQVVECLSQQANWAAWRSLAWSSEEDTPLDEIDYMAWQKFRTRIRSLSETDGGDPSSGFVSNIMDAPSISALVFSEDEEHGFSAGNSVFEANDISRLTTDRGGRELKTALSACRGELVALVKESDRVDSGWAEAASRHFLDPELSLIHI